MLELFSRKIRLLPDMVINARIVGYPEDISSAHRIDIDKSACADQPPYSKISDGEVRSEVAISESVIALVS